MHRNTLSQKDLNTFLILLIISLVGNSCADFAIIWHSISQIDPSSNHVPKNLLSSFYIGQSLGIIGFAPLLSAFIDRLPKRVASVGLDFCYALFLIGILALYHGGHLNSVSLLTFAMMTAALGTLHRNAIGFGALKSLSKNLDLTQIVAKFGAASFFTSLAGSSISGSIYHYFGLTGCLAFAILTFLPMPLIYFKIFPKEPDQILSHKEGSYFSDLKSGIAFILKDKILITISISIAFWNIASSIFPSIVGIAFQKSLPGRTDLASYAVSLAILTGVLAFRPMERISKSFLMNRIMPISLLAPSIMLGICSLYPSPIAFTLAFALHCCGASLVNIMSGSTRVARVPSTMTGRVNTAHSSIVQFGQIAGATFLIPTIQSNIPLGAAVITMAFLISALIAYQFLPKIQFKNVVATLK